MQFRVSQKFEMIKKNNNKKADLMFGMVAVISFRLGTRYRQPTTAQESLTLSVLDTVGVVVRRP